MKLIRELGTKRNKNGTYVSYGEFLCGFDNKIVIRQLSAGKLQKSCGCVRYELSSKSLKGQKRTEEQNKRNSEAHKGQSSSFKGKKHTEEAKNKIREAHLGKYDGENNPNYGNGDKIRGSRNPMYGKYGELAPNWQGGKSFEIYPQEFKQIKKFILERDNYKCQNPKCKGFSNKLHVHHIDYNKNSNKPENLITLCHSCHSKTVDKNIRNYYTEFYQNIMMNRLIECLL